MYQMKDGNGLGNDIPQCSLAHRHLKGLSDVPQGSMILIYRAILSVIVLDPESPPEKEEW